MILAFSFAKTKKKRTKKEQKESHNEE